MARPGLNKHPKFRRLVATLKEPMPHVRGYLELLWEVGYESGNPMIGDATDVALACEYPGQDPEVITRALLSCGGEGNVGFIEPDTEQPTRYQIHDLHDHAPEYVKRRMEREQERRAKGRTISDIRRESGKKGAIKRYEHEEIRTYDSKRKSLADPHVANGATPAPAPAPAPIKSPNGDLRANRTPSPIPELRDDEPVAPAASKSNTVGRNPQRMKTVATGPHAELIAHFTSGWRERFKERYHFQDAKDGTAIGRLLKACGGDLAKAKRIVTTYLLDDDPFITSKGHTIAMLGSDINAYLSGAKRHGSDGPARPTNRPLQAAKVFDSEAST